MSSPRSSASENDEELGPLPLRLPARYEMYAFDPPAGATERRKRQRLALSGGDENPTNEPSTSAARVVPELVCRCKCCIQWEKIRDCEKRCCFDVREMRDLMQEEDMAEECFTSHPGFLLACFNKHVMKINAAAFHRTDKGRYIARLPANKRNRYIAYSAVIRLVYGRMGRGNREPLPACVVGAIRRHYPESESAEGSAYTEFRFADESDAAAEADDDDE